MIHKTFGGTLTPISYFSFQREKFSAYNFQGLTSKLNRHFSKHFLSQKKKKIRSKANSTIREAFIPVPCHCGYELSAKSLLIRRFHIENWSIPLLFTNPQSQIFQHRATLETSQKRPPTTPSSLTNNFVFEN